MSELLVKVLYGCDVRKIHICNLSTACPSEDAFRVHHQLAQYHRLVNLCPVLYDHNLHSGLLLPLLRSLADGLLHLCSLLLRSLQPLGILLLQCFECSDLGSKPVGLRLCRLTDCRVGCVLRCLRLREKGSQFRLRIGNLLKGVGTVVLVLLIIPLHISHRVVLPKGSLVHSSVLVHIRIQLLRVHDGLCSLCTLYGSSGLRCTYSVLLIALCASLGIPASDSSNLLVNELLICLRLVRHIENLRHPLPVHRVLLAVGVDVVDSGLVE